MTEQEEAVLLAQGQETVNQLVLDALLTGGDWFNILADVVIASGGTLEDAAVEWNSITTV